MKNNSECAEKEGWQNATGKMGFNIPYQDSQGNPMPNDTLLLQAFAHYEAWRGSRDFQTKRKEAIADARALALEAAQEKCDQCKCPEGYWCKATLTGEEKLVDDEDVKPAPPTISTQSHSRFSTRDEGYMFSTVVHGSFKYKCSCEPTLGRKIKNAAGVIVLSGAILFWALRTYLSGPPASQTPSMPTSKPVVEETATPAPATKTVTPMATRADTPTATDSTIISMGDGSYFGEFDVVTDPGGHEEFVGMPEVMPILVTRDGARISFVGPAPWVAVEGTLADSGSFTASGTGPVAGYSSIAVLFTGILAPGGLEGDYIMGEKGGLPGGEAITFYVSAYPEGAELTTFEESDRDEEYFYQRGIFHYELGDIQAALDEFDRALEVDPAYAPAHFSRGNIFYWDLGNSQDAISDFEAAIASDPSYAPAYYALGITHYELGNQDAAIQNLQGFLDLVQVEDEFTVSAREILDELKGE